MQNPGNMSYCTLVDITRTTCWTKSRHFMGSHYV